MRITQHDSAQGAKGYYEVSDYFEAGPEELKGTYLGRTAEMLGLTGGVDKESFERMVDNLHPTTGERLRPRTRDKRNGWDITLSAPKSFSILHGLTGDQRLLTIFQESLEDTFALFEQEAMTRINTARGMMHHETTGNLAAASWIHLTARPTPGQAPDPQIHGHIYTFNLTHDADRNRFTAVDISNIYRDTGYFNAYFQSQLASKAKSLGYQIERSAYGFEIAGISRSLIDKFSKRSSEVAAEEDRVKEELGIDRLSERAKGNLGRDSRSRKSDCKLTAAELPNHWRSQLTASERAQLDRVQSRRLPARQARISPRESVDYATQHRFERQTVVRERELKKDAMLYGIESNTPADIESAFNNQQWLSEGKSGNALVTTPEVQEEERQILKFARDGRGCLAPIRPDHHIKRDFLSDEQQTMVTGLLNSTDQVNVVRGAAGAGKTTATSEAVEAIEAAGIPVAVMAPTTKAAYDVLAADGFDATTIAAFLQDEEKQKDYRHGVLWADEAGLIDNPTMLKLMRAAEELDARLVLVGDSKQHAPVGRGTPLKQIELHAGITPFEITNIRRQQGEYKSAVESLSRGDLLKGVEGLSDLGFVHELGDGDRYQRLARDYADALDDVGDDKKKLIIIAPTHRERSEVETAVRRKLKQREKLGDDDIDVTTLHSRRLTKAERSDALNYRVGDRVAFHAKGKGGFQSGDQLIVGSVKNDKVLSTNGREIPLSSSGAFDVFEPRMSHFATGDLIRITRKRREAPGRKRLNNGSVFEVTSVEDGILKLDNGESIDPKRWAFFENGLTLTSHASQGATVSRAFLAQSSMSYGASSPEQLYVSASRARRRVDIYTDNLESLKHVLERGRPALSALDISGSEEGMQTSPQTGIRHQWNRIKQVAHQFATRQLQKFHDWLPNRSIEPEMAR